MENGGLTGTACFDRFDGGTASAEHHRGTSAERGVTIN